jgi:hypothetical protein
MSDYTGQQSITSTTDVSNEHPLYQKNKEAWRIVRDAVDGEITIKRRGEMYLPRPAGMTGIYSEAYGPYKERAHYPQIAAYALQGSLGIIITKLPEFNVPSQLEYILTNASSEGYTIKQLFLDVVIEVIQTGRCVLVVDIEPSTNHFTFVLYTAEAFINWKEEKKGGATNLILGVFKEAVPAQEDIFAHETEDAYRVMLFNDKDEYTTFLHVDDGKGYVSSSEDMNAVVPKYVGKTMQRLPIFIAGSIDNSIEPQPVPLLSVANCSIQIYRKEADLSNSEYLSCNPTLCMVGASNDDDLPNVVGSSVMIVLPDPQARIFYTVTDTAALKHVKQHIDDLYDEAIRHGVAILDNRKGVESAEALRIRQATQSATIYSIYLSSVNAIKNGLEYMADWGGWDKEDIVIDAPASLSYGIPDSAVIREIVSGFGANVIPIDVVHRYLVNSGLLKQTVGLEEYKEQLKEQQAYIKTTILQKPGSDAPVAKAEPTPAGDSGIQNI